MFFEFLAHLASFDLAWVFAFVLSNLHWLFFFALFAYFFWGEKSSRKWVFMTAFFIFWVWVWGDVSIGMAGWGLPPAFAFAFIVSFIAREAFINGNPHFKGKELFIAEMTFFVLFIAYNVFWV